jgi:8-oxo-dGTP pyrophosphatase MutT (NUDIX family)
VTGPSGLDRLADLARAFASGEKTPVEPRDASTVVLLRDTSAGPEVYLLRRHSGMAFASGMHVFPGGSVDPADAEAHVRWSGPSPAQWGTWFGADESVARALVCAAVRETFEECGVLLAGTSEHELLADVSDDAWEQERQALEAREQSLSELLTRRGLVLRSDLLRPFAHWITPVVEPKRFDTRFFLAQLPAGQVCRDVGSEADERLWVRPQQAIDDGVTMLPPTYSCLIELSGGRDVASLLEQERTVTPVAPQLLVRDDGSIEFQV